VDHGIKDTADFSVGIMDRQSAPGWAKLRAGLGEARGEGVAASGITEFEGGGRFVGQPLSKLVLLAALHRRLMAANCAIKMTFHTAVMSHCNLSLRKMWAAFRGHLPRTKVPGACKNLKIQE
jgi:hypothetical protein